MRRTARSSWLLLLGLVAAATGCLEGDPNPYDQKEMSSAGSSSVAPRTCSQPNGVSATLTFNNRRQRPLRVYWVDFSCQAQLSAEVFAGQSHVASTQSGYVWRLHDSATNALVLEYIATTASTQQVEVTGP